MGFIGRLATMCGKTKLTRDVDGSVAVLLRFYPVAADCGDSTAVLRSMRVA